MSRTMTHQEPLPDPHQGSPTFWSEISGTGDSGIGTQDDISICIRRLTAITLTKPQVQVPFTSQTVAATWLLLPAAAGCHNPPRRERCN